MLWAATANQIVNNTFPINLVIIFIIHKSTIEFVYEVTDSHILCWQVGSDCQQSILQFRWREGTCQDVSEASCPNARLVNTRFTKPATTTRSPISKTYSRCPVGQLSDPHLITTVSTTNNSFLKKIFTQATLQTLCWVFGIILLPTFTWHYPSPSLQEHYLLGDSGEHQVLIPIASCACSINTHLWNR